MSTSRKSMILEIRSDASQAKAEVADFREGLRSMLAGVDGGGMKMLSGALGVIDSVGGVVRNLNPIVRELVGAARLAVELIEFAGQRTKLQSLVSEQVLASMRESSAGLVGDMALMKIGANSLNGEFALTRQELDGVIRGVRVLTDAKGLDFYDVLVKVTDAISQGEIGALRDLGLNLEAATGKTEKLTLAKQKLIQAGERDGEIVDDEAERVRRAFVKVNNAIDEVKGGAGGAFEDLMVGVSGVGGEAEITAEQLGKVRDQWDIRPASAKGDSFGDEMAKDLKRVQEEARQTELVLREVEDALDMIAGDEVRRAAAHKTLMDQINAYTEAALENSAQAVLEMDQREDELAKQRAKRWAEERKRAVEEADEYARRGMFHREVMLPLERVWDSILENEKRLQEQAQFSAFTQFKNDARDLADTITQWTIPAIFRADKAERQAAQHAETDSERQRHEIEQSKQAFLSLVAAKATAIFSGQEDAISAIRNLLGETMLSLSTTMFGEAFLALGQFISTGAPNKLAAFGMFMTGGVAAASVGGALISPPGGASAPATAGAGGGRGFSESPSNGNASSGVTEVHFHLGSGFVGDENKLGRELTKVVRDVGLSGSSTSDVGARRTGNAHARQH